MSSPSDPLDLAELSERADVSVRTVRYYIQQGLLPSPEARGPGAHYGPEHLDRLVLIRRLQRDHLPLAEIRRRLEALGPDEVRDLVERGGERAPSSARDYIRGVLSEGVASLEESPPDAPYAPAIASMPAVPGAPPTVRERASSATAARSQWDRIALAPDVELHVRRPLSRGENKQVERLLQAARDIFQGDAP